MFAKVLDHVARVFKVLQPLLVLLAQVDGTLGVERCDEERFVCLLVGCLTSQQQASVSQGRICSDNCTCCHTEIEVADPTFYLTQSQYTDTGPTSPSADPRTPGAWQGNHWSAQFLSHWYDSAPKKSRRKQDSNPGSSALEADALPLGQRGGRRGKVDEVRRMHDSSFGKGDLCLVYHVFHLNNNDNNDRTEKRNSRFHNLLTPPRTVSNTYAPVARAQSCANHVQHIERLSCTTCCVPCGMKVQLNYEV